MLRPALLLAATLSFLPNTFSRGEDLAASLAWSTLVKEPMDFAGVAFVDDTVRLSHAAKWSFLRTATSFDNVEVNAKLTIEKPASQLGFFGQSWSAWPDRNYGDGGFDAAVQWRGSAAAGYRVQLSHKYQQVALVKWPQGGYIRSVACDVKVNSPHVLTVSARGHEIVVSVDGAEKFRFTDVIEPLKTGHIGVGVSSLSQVRFESLQVRNLDTLSVKTETNAKHTPRFSSRTWIGGRPWVFDGDEPIMLLLAPESSTINNVKLRPGYKPLLCWNSHWDIQNQGAYPEGTNRPGPPTIFGGGKTLDVSWKARQKNDRFETRTKMTIAWDDIRQVYTYDVDSELEVLPGEPFHFRYGYDFEHHTPLDPFNWQYLLIKREGGVLNRRPVYAFDPGPMNDVEGYHGARVWYGRHSSDFYIAPVVEYHIDPQLNPDPQKPGEALSRKLSTAVCAAFYDTAVAFGAETAKPGTKVRVKYRYTGYPAEEAQRLFASSTHYNAPTLDPSRHFIFVDSHFANLQEPRGEKVTFSQFATLGETWARDRIPFHSGHNLRPKYELAKNTGVGSGFAMKLGPQGSAIANLPLASPLARGKYLVRCLAKSENTHGPGGCVEIVATDKSSSGNYVRHATKVLREERHYVGNGTFDWKPVQFMTEIPSEAPAIAIGFRNEGTGNVLFTELELRTLKDGEPLPVGTLAKANTSPPASEAAPEGALADYRLREGDGLYTLDHAQGPFGNLELANLDFVQDKGGPALRFSDNLSGRRDYPRGGVMTNYLDHKSYEGKQTTPTAIAGHHGGGFELPALTISTWIKPAANMGDSPNSSGGHVVGVGARRFILMLEGKQAPYRLAGVLNVSDRVASEPIIQADRWQHVAMTCAPHEGKWKTQLFLDGHIVAEGNSQRLASPTNIPPSLILGAEIFYLHHAYYRGLIGRTVVLSRTVNVDELRQLGR